MTITASMVKTLRERTGAGMMDCKKALSETGGDMEAAIELMRASGQAKAIKKAGRVAAEGIITVAAADNHVVMVEINCETDFVARDDSFQAFVQAAQQVALAASDDTLETVLQTPSASGESLETLRQNLVAKIGENIQLRRLVRFQSSHLLAHYVHGNKIGVLVELEGGDDTLAKDVAMHIAACKPEVIAPQEVDEARQAKEKAFFMEQAQESGKPQDIIEKMIVGKMKKFLDEISLLGQGFVKNPEHTVGQLLKEKQAKVLRFARFEVGEGREKKVEDFAAEVMEQLKDK